MVNAIPTANANLVGFGFGFGATVPLLATLLIPVPVLVPVGRGYRGANRRRCVSYFTLHRDDWFRVRNGTRIEFQKPPWLCRKCVSVTVRIVTGGPRDTPIPA